MLHLNSPGKRDIKALGQGPATAPAATAHTQPPKEEAVVAPHHGDAPTDHQVREAYGGLEGILQQTGTADAGLARSAPDPSAQGRAWPPAPTARNRPPGMDGQAVGGQPRGPDRQLGGGTPGNEVRRPQKGLTGNSGAPAMQEPADQRQREADGQAVGGAAGWAPARPEKAKAGKSAAPPVQAPSDQEQRPGFKKADQLEQAYQEDIRALGLNPEGMGVNSVEKFTLMSGKAMLSMQWEHQHKAKTKMTFDQFAADKMQKVPGLTMDEILALVAYTSPCYVVMNKYQRAELKSEKFIRLVKPLIALSGSALGKLSTGKKVKTFRGLREWPNGGAEQVRRDYGNGAKEKMFYGLTSTTVKASAADHFDGPVAMEITSRSGAKITEFSIKPDEKELLLPPDTLFDINSAVEDKKLVDQWNNFFASGKKQAKPKKPAFIIHLTEK